MKRGLFFWFTMMTIALCAQKASNPSKCDVIRQLLAAAGSGKLGAEARESIPNDDLETWRAATTVPGASRCVIQDAVTTKAYTAEYGVVFSAKEDAALTQQFHNLTNEFRNCFKSGFKENPIGASDGLFRGLQFEGVGAFANVNVNFFHIYNPSDKRQYVSMTIIYDPD
ncbi:MAG: hypothetical protein U0T84_09070 [Chitinophagales bacterium]